MNDVAAGLARTRATHRMVHRIGGAWFFAPEVRAVGAAAGIEDRFALYAGGRGGVIGDPTGDVVAATFAFFPPRVVIGKYRIATAVSTPREVADVYAAGLARWAEATFGEDDGWTRLAGLARRVAEGVHAMGLCLFAGWRAMPRPEHPAADMAQALHVLRELRGDLHVQAVVASGMTPLEAIVGKDGPERARELFYPEPYPDAAALAGRREAVELLTDRLVAPSWTVLEPAERDEVDRVLARALTCLPEG